MKKTAKKAAKKATKAPAAPTDELHRQLGIIVDARRQLPVLKESERQLFWKQLNDAHCLGVGEKTQSKDVLQQLADWAPSLLAGVLRHEKQLVGFSPRRLAYVFAVGEELGHDIEAQLVGQGGAADGTARLARATAAARGDRTGLVKVLRGSLGDDDATEQAELSAALGGTGTSPEVSDSLSGLVTLAERWRARTDGDWPDRFVEAGLTADLVGHARTAAEELSAALSKKPGRYAPKGDSEAVNRIEGRLSLGLLLALHTFDDARARFSDIPKLIPNPKMRVVLAPKKAAAAEPAPVAPDPVAPEDKKG